MHLLIENETKVDMTPYEDDIQAVIFAVLDLEEVTHDVEVSLTYTDNEEIRLINKEHRDKDMATDVLSFPMVQVIDGELQLEDSKNYTTGDIMLGDIIISLERAEEQAKDFGHSFKREVCFLVAHSMLHLLGYDHMTEEEETRMISKQKIVMEKVGILR